MVYLKRMFSTITPKPIGEKPKPFGCHWVTQFVPNRLGYPKQERPPRIQLDLFS